MKIEVLTYSVTRAYRFPYAYSLGDGLPVENQLKLEDIVVMARKLSDIGVEHSLLTGVGLTGEPYVRNDMDRIIEIFSDYGLGKLYVKSDGLLINRDNIKTLSRYGARVILEFGGPRDVDAIVRGAGFYEKSLAIAKTLIDEGILHSLSIPLTKHIVHRLKDVIDIALELGVSRVRFPTLIPQPLVFGREHIFKKLSVLEPSPWEREEFLRNIYMTSKSLDERIRLTPYVIFYRRILKAYEPQLKLETTCELHLDQTRYSGIEILDDGDIYVCSALGLKFGNIRYIDSLHRVFDEIRKSEYVKQLIDRNRIIGKCSYCNFYSICAGCRARAYQYTGNPFLSDPACTYIPPVNP